MTGDEVREDDAEVSVRESPDPSPWSPESDARFDHRPIAIPSAADQAVHPARSPATALDDGRRPRRIPAVVAAVAAVAVVIVGVLIVTRLSGPTGTAAPSRSSVDRIGSVSDVEPLVVEPFAGADPRRLPPSITPQWEQSLTEVQASADSSVFVDGTDVYAVFDAVDENSTETPPRSVVHAFDAATGAVRWQVSIDSGARALSVLGVLDGVLVIERLDTGNRSVLGIDVNGGDGVRWERATADPGIHVVLEGTPVLARVSFTVNARLTFIDPRTGDEVGRLPGRLVATDFVGTWYVRNADQVSRLDLADGWQPPTLLGTVWNDDDEVVSVVDGRLMVIDDGFVEVLDDDGQQKRSATLGVGSGGFAGLDSAPVFLRLSPMADESLIMSADATVYGAALLDDGDLDVRWRAAGTPVATRPSDRGLLLLVARDGDEEQSVVDGSTGREVAAVPDVVGARESLVMVGNGVVLKQRASFGFERVALDLDGNVLWTLVGDGPISIGDGVVVTYGPTDDGVVLTTYT